MSAIFGLFYFNGRNVLHGQMETMGAPLDEWGPVGNKYFVEGCAGLGYSHLNSTPEASFEIMPLKDRDSGVVFSVAARLDNRDELCDFFHIPTNERPSLPDGRLVSMAYNIWGEQSPEHLKGDWSFAAWDGRRRHLFIARDTLGISGLFYCYKPPYFSFASSPTALLSLPETPKKINEQQLARLLSVFHGNKKTWGNTFWEDIRLLLPGHCLSVTPESINIRNYWRIEDVPSLCYKSTSDYIEGFLERFKRAVTVRLRSERPIGTQLSAGLDSGSVTALAAENLQVSDRRIYAFTSVPLGSYNHPSNGSLIDEWDLASDVAKNHGNIDHIAVNSENTSPLEAVHQCLNILGHPVHAVTNLFWIMDILEKARDRGIGVMLTGQMGNNGISWTGGRNRIYFLFCVGHWKKGWDALEVYRRVKGCSWQTALYTQLMAPFLARIRQNAHGIVHPKVTPWRSYSAIHHDFAERIGLRESMRLENHEPTFALTGNPDAQRKGGLIFGARSGYIYQHLGSAFNLEFRDPTADQNLIEFCLGIPEEIYISEGQTRALIRNAMTGLLPDRVRTNERRGRQAVDVGYRLLAWEKEMEKELIFLENNSRVRTYIDTPYVRSAWQAIKENPSASTHRKTAAMLLRSIMAGRFVAK